ncbi:Type 1 phosphatases regulator ypi1 [Exophiala xenobiotica]|uniref:Type 1 phosphatases regulator n=1 Tax=Lithohypha guttulata TaxID=1690604 RepID=A0ABR0JXE0_9EURO|nr:Type 1 phosphatases regulator ypi1 [Lithohypha guttulata]KAK5330721.1 Type 1 phosphatases regulator ypi1 [Exophiala xenobiotica]
MSASASPARRAPPRRAANHPPQTQTRTRTRGPGSGTATPEGSATQTITSAPPQSDGLVLHLRGAHEPETQTQSRSNSEEPQSSTRRRIKWAEDVVDNEGLGRKKSKVCCIFHKTREVGESSSEDDSSSHDEGGSGSSPSDDDGGARPVGGRRRGRGRGRGQRRHEHEHGDGDGCGHGEKRKPSPNAYEKMPKYDVKPLERQPGNIATLQQKAFHNLPLSNSPKKDKSSLPEGLRHSVDDEAKPPYLGQDHPDWAVTVFSAVSYLDPRGEDVAGHGTMFRRETGIPDKTRHEAR